MPRDVIDKPEWQRFLDRVSRGLAGKQVEIEVAALGLGDQIVTQWVPVLGLVMSRGATRWRSPSRVSTT